MFTCSLKLFFNGLSVRSLPSRFPYDVRDRSGEDGPEFLAPHGVFGEQEGSRFPQDWLLGTSLLSGALPNAAITAALINRLACYGEDGREDPRGRPMAAMVRWRRLAPDWTRAAVAPAGLRTRRGGILHDAWAL